MSADIKGIADQLSKMILEGGGKDLRTEPSGGTRGALIGNLHSAIAQAASLARSIAELDRNGVFGRCGHVAAGELCGSCAEIAAIPGVAA